MSVSRGVEVASHATEGWEKDAACRPDDEPLLFARESAAQREAVNRICLGRSCPVILACREASRAVEFGVWGAMTQKQRKYWAARTRT